MVYDAEVAAAVSQARRVYGVALDPALIHAVIERETRHRAYPPEGTLEPNGHRSYGPMQVEDITGQAHGITDPSTLSVPSVGIRIGAYELARLTKLFPGDTAAVVAGFNGGPGLAHRNSAGKFPNQSYVDAVISFFARFKGLAVKAAPAAGLIALAVGLLVMVLASRRGRLATR